MQSRCGVRDRVDIMVRLSTRESKPRLTVRSFCMQRELALFARLCWSFFICIFFAPSLSQCSLRLIVDNCLLNAQPAVQLFYDKTGAVPHLAV